MVTTFVNGISGFSTHLAPLNITATSTMMTTNTTGQYIYMPTQSIKWGPVYDNTPQLKPHSDWHYNFCKCGDCPHN